VAGSVGAVAAFLSLCVSWGRRQSRRTDSFRSVKPDAFMEALNSTYTVLLLFFVEDFRFAGNAGGSLGEISGR
jgi:hypothetical protein